MGHGISVSGAHREKPTVFVDELLLKGCKEMVDSPAVRAAFLNYIKGGEWLDHITKLQQTQLKPLTREQRLAIEHDSPLFAYSMTDESRRKIDETITALSGSEATSGHTLPTQSSPKHAQPVASPLGDLDGCYFPIDNFCSFSKQELVAVMLSIVLPLFKDCADISLYFKQKPDEKEEAYDDFSPEAFQKPPLFTQSSRRAQACLLSCAANFQESELSEHVSDPHWPDHVDSAFDGYHLPIAVIDTNNVIRPFVFVNKAFERVFELSRRSALGRNYDEFSGPETEEDLATLVQEALRTNVSCKAAITHYTSGKKKKKFLDFVAVRASGGYTFAVHCPGDSPTLLEDVKVRVPCCLCCKESPSLTAVLCWLFLHP
jgi:PAS domain-containing protein